MHHDDPPEEYIRKAGLTHLLRPRPPIVQLNCPYCPHRVYGLDDTHARELLAIHTEGTCQGEVVTDGRSDPARDPALDLADVPRLTPGEPPAGSPPTPGRDPR